MFPDQIEVNVSLTKNYVFSTKEYLIYCETFGIEPTKENLTQYIKRDIFHQFINKSRIEEANFIFTEMDSL